MSSDEVEHIMHIMYAAVHNGHPYAEDYYYQVGMPIESYCYHAGLHMNIAKFIIKIYTDCLVHD